MDVAVTPALEPYHVAPHPPGNHMLLNVFSMTNAVIASTW
jgi:hypothetical protein